MSPESEQGASPERRCSPASLDVTVALEWNPEFTLEAEPGYEQCRRGRQRAAAAADTDHEGLLLLQRLESAVTELGRGVDELEVDLLHGATVRLHQQRLKDDNVTVGG